MGLWALALSLSKLKPGVAGDGWGSHPQGTQCVAVFIIFMADSVFRVTLMVV